MSIHDHNDDRAMTPYDPVSICERTEVALRKRTWSWAKLAERTGINEKTFQRWRSGETVPQIGRLCEVATALGTTYEELTEGLPLRPTLPPPDLDPTPVPRDPYDPWKHADRSTFVGRHATVNTLVEALTQWRSANLVGDRRIGKTSMLRTWEQIARESGYTVAFVSGENTCGLSAGALVAAITGTRAPDDADGAADTLTAWLRARPRDEAPPLILVDEFDGFALKVDNHRFLQRLRGMVGDGMVVLVLATSKHLCELCQPGQTSPFENLLETVQLGLLEADEAEQIIGRRAGALVPEDANALRSWCGRHPFYLKLLAHHLLAARYQGWTSERAVETFRLKAGYQLESLWSGHLKPLEQDALRNMIRGETLPAKALRRLKHRGVLTEEGKPFGEVLTRWLEELT